MPDIDLDAIEARLNAVPYRDMHVAVAPAAGSTETAAEYMASALQSDGPIWVVWSPANDDSAPYLVNAITGDGPTSEATADLIAHAPTDLAALVTEVRTLRNEIDAYHSADCYGTSCLNCAQLTDTLYAADMEAEALRTVAEAAQNVVTADDAIFHDSEYGEDAAQADRDSALEEVRAALDAWRAGGGA